MEAAAGWRTCSLFLSRPHGLRVGILPGQVAALLNAEQPAERRGAWLWARPRELEMQLPEVPMLRIFSFLDAASLLRAGQVSRVSAPRLPSLSPCPLRGSV